MQQMNFEGDSCEHRFTGVFVRPTWYKIAVLVPPSLLFLAVLLAIICSYPRNIGLSNYSILVAGIPFLLFLGHCSLSVSLLEEGVVVKSVFKKRSFMNRESVRVYVSEGLSDIFYKVILVSRRKKKIIKGPFVFFKDEKDFYAFPFEESSRIHVYP